MSHRIPLWPRRWLLVQLLPALAAMAAAAAVAVALWSLAGGAVTGSVLAGSSALALLVGYALQLVCLARMEWGERPWAGGINRADARAVRGAEARVLRADLVRYLPSLVIRALGVALLLWMLGMETAAALPAGAAASLAVGFVRLTRQRAILLTFAGDEPG